MSPSRCKDFRNTIDPSEDGMNVAAQMSMNEDKNAPPPAIEFRNVYLSFEDQLALNDISFTLNQGYQPHLVVVRYKEDARD